MRFSLVGECRIFFTKYYIFLGIIAHKSVKKNRQDLNAALLDQFVSGIPGAVFEKSMTQLISEGEATAFVRKDNATQNLVIALMFLFLRFTNKQLYHLQSTVCSQNIANLCSMEAADTIIQFCQSLPHLATFIDNWNCAAEGKGLRIPSTMSEAQQLKQNMTRLKEEVLLAKKALNLFLLEPFTHQLTQLGMGSLLAAIFVATSHCIFTDASNPALLLYARILLLLETCTTLHLPC